ncbi:MAG: hypothetical protein IH985_02145 [Planctomycetes bacterium]|nr:hypothetical protein [Planctomycetota bacterium]
MDATNRTLELHELLEAAYVAVGAVQLVAREVARMHRFLGRQGFASVVVAVQQAHDADSLRIPTSGVSELDPTWVEVTQDRIETAVEVLTSLQADLRGRAPDLYREAADTKGLLVEVRAKLHGPTDRESLTKWLGDARAALPYHAESILGQARKSLAHADQREDKQVNTAEPAPAEQTQLASEPKMPNYIKLAGASLEWLGTKRADLIPDGQATEDERKSQWEYLRDHGCPAYPDSIPSFETWTKYVRDYLRLTKGPRNTSRAGRTGRSIVRSDGSRHDDKVP